MDFFTSRKIPIHTVGAGQAYDRKLLENIAAETSGKFVPANKIEELSTVMKRFAYETLAGKFSPNRVAGWALIGLAIGLCSGTFWRKGHCFRRAGGIARRRRRRGGV